MEKTISEKQPTVLCFNTSLQTAKLITGNIFHQRKHEAETSQPIIHCANLIADPKLSQSDGHHMPLQYSVSCHYVNGGHKHPAAVL